MIDKEKSIEEGFKPLLGRQPQVLILGTMPSVQSLKTQQYYGHPRNAFWWIMSELCGFDFALPYEERVAHLLLNNIAVWDVIASCHRPGSLDSKIDQSTVTVNRLFEVFEKHPSLKLIAFNCQAAEKLFTKFINLLVFLPFRSIEIRYESKTELIYYWCCKIRYNFIV